MSVPNGVSVIVPLYNEAYRLENNAKHILTYLQSLDIPFEIILVDDGSTDNTKILATQFAHKFSSVKCLSYGFNRGKGYAVRTGMLASRFRLALFIDADLSYPIEELSNLLPWVEQGYDVVIGSRKLPQARAVIAQPPLRRFLGRGFSFLCSLLFVPSVRDFMCGLKLFTRRAIEKTFPYQTLWRWAFDTEILYLAHRAGLRIKEIPIRWRHNSKSKVRVLRAVVSSSWELVRLIWKRCT